MRSETEQGANEQEFAIDVRLTGHGMASLCGRSNLTALEALGFVRGGMLFLVPPERWASWHRTIWRDCQCAPRRREYHFLEPGGVSSRLARSARGEW
jgi:hypothetical protein